MYGIPIAGWIIASSIHRGNWDSIIELLKKLAEMFLYLLRHVNGLGVACDVSVPVGGSSTPVGIILFNKAAGCKNW